MKGKKPKPPSASSMIAAESKAKQDAARYNTVATSGSVTGPYGAMNKSIEYQPDPNDPTKMIPVQSTEYSFDPRTQGLSDAATDTSQQAFGKMQGYLSGDTSTADEITGRINELGSKFLDPRLAQARREAEERQASQGISMGSTLADRSARNRAMAESDARNSLLLQGWGQGQAALNADRAFAMNAANTGIGARGALMGQGTGMANQNINPNMTAVNAAQHMNTAYQNKKADYDSTPGLWDVASAGLGTAASMYAGGFNPMAALGIGGSFAPK